MKRILGLVLAGLLTIGVVGCQTTGSSPKPPTEVTAPSPVSIYVEDVQKLKKGSATVWSYILTETSHLITITGQRIEQPGQKPTFILAFGKGTTNGADPALELWDSRRTQYEVVKEFDGKTNIRGNVVDINGIAIIFDGQYKFMYTNIPTNTFYVKFQSGTYEFKMTQDQWNNMLNWVMRKEGLDV